MTAQPHWTEGMATGIRELDAVNQGLGFLLGRLFEPGVECRRRYGACDRTACTRIGAILRYMSRNFVEHEAMMAQDGYPQREDHARDHRLLEQRLKAMQAAKVCGDSDRAVVRDFVTKWAACHIQRCDQPVGSWVAAKD